MSDSTSGNLSLPEFDNSSTYLLKGETLNQIMSVIKENRVVISDGSFQDIGPDGSVIETLELKVCINGVATTKNFLISSN